MLTPFPTHTDSDGDYYNLTQDTCYIWGCIRKAWIEYATLEEAKKLKLIPIK